MIQLSGAGKVKTTTVKHLSQGKMSRKYFTQKHIESSLSQLLIKAGWEELGVPSKLSFADSDRCVSLLQLLFSWDTLSFTDFLNNDFWMLPDRALLLLDCLHSGCSLCYLLSLVPNTPPTHTLSASLFKSLREHWISCWPGFHLSPAQ